MSSTFTTATEAGFPAIAGDHWIDTLNDGRHVLIRPIRPDDREREREFINRLSASARHFRFLGEIGSASPQLLDQMLDVDGQDTVALVALVHDNGVLREVGVSRYAATGETKRCEFAVVVADDWQHHGLAVILMRHLIGMARRNGFRQMYSLDSSDNEPMHELAHFLGFSRTADPDDSAQVIHTLDL